jgi:predicted nucleotidyltransferase
MKERVNITAERELLDLIDAAAASEHTTRSALIRRVMREYVEGRPGGAVARQLPAGSAGLAAEARAEYVPGTLAPPTPRALDELAPLLRSFFAARDDVETAWVFGSVARGRTWARSDVDVAVLPADESLSRRERGDLRMELTWRLSEALRADVDVAVFGQGSTLLWHRIVSEGVIVYGEGIRAAEATMRAISAHMDYRPAIDVADRQYLEKVAGYDALR